jgi:hypothetical protein
MFQAYVAYHQEVFTVYVQELVRVTGFGDWQLAGYVMVAVMLT